MIYYSRCIVFLSFLFTHYYSCLYSLSCCCSPILSFSIFPIYLLLPNTLYLPHSLFFTCSYYCSYYVLVLLLFLYFILSLLLIFLYFYLTQYNLARQYLFLSSCFYFCPCSSCFCCSFSLFYHSLPPSPPTFLSFPHTVYTFNPFTLPPPL